MNKDNFVKNCHLIAEDAKLIDQGKNALVIMKGANNDIYSG